MIIDLASQAYNALRHNRRRSMLTMLGMAWGIATVVLLLAYGSGFERGLWSAFRSFGTNLVFIFPGAPSYRLEEPRRARKFGSRSTILITYGPKSPC
jgi:putative ABC transport system permease protein